VKITKALTTSAANHKSDDVKILNELFAGSNSMTQRQLLRRQSVTYRTQHTINLMLVSMLVSSVVTLYMILE
jgi:hypothetical protein